MAPARRRNSHPKFSINRGPCLVFPQISVFTRCISKFVSSISLTLRITERYPRVPGATSKPLPWQLPPQGCSGEKHQCRQVALPSPTAWLQLPECAVPGAERQGRSQETGIWQGNNLFNCCLAVIKTFPPVLCQTVPRALSSTHTFSVMCFLKPFSALHQ